MSNHDAEILVVALSCVFFHKEIRVVSLLLLSVIDLFFMNIEYSWPSRMNWLSSETS